MDGKSNTEDDVSFELQKNDVFSYIERYRGRDSAGNPASDEEELEHDIMDDSYNEIEAISENSPVGHEIMNDDNINVGDNAELSNKNVVKIKDPVISGGLDKRIIQKIVRDHSGELKTVICKNFLATRPLRAAL